MTVRWPAVVAAWLFAAPLVHAQANLQLWGNSTFDWVKNDRLTYEIDVEPKVLLAAPEGDPGWWNVDATPSAEYAAKNWLDVVGELATGITKQTDDNNSFELTPRVGLRFQIRSRELPRPLPRLPRLVERPPKHRIVLRDLIRVESRNFFYFGTDTENSSTVRFRNRFEFLAPLNKENLTDDGARYLIADWEWFIPLDDAEERFANKQRIRAGLGYRRDFTFRFEALYIWTRSRNTISEGFSTSDHIIDIRVKKYF